jgi:hypothetical protein
MERQADGYLPRVAVAPACATAIRDAADAGPQAHRRRVAGRAKEGKRHTLYTLLLPPRPTHSSLVYLVPRTTTVFSSSRTRRGCRAAAGCSVCLPAAAEDGPADAGASNGSLRGRRPHVKASFCRGRGASRRTAEGTTRGAGTQCDESQGAAHAEHARASTTHKKSPARSL